MAEHTPGPWRFDDCNDEHPNEQPRVSSRTKLVACVGNAQDAATFKPEWIANARLIAAAPAMLEALTQTTQALQALRKDVMRQPSMQGRQYVGLGIQVNDAIYMAEAAISAALGADASTEGEE